MPLHHKSYHIFQTFVAVKEVLTNIIRCAGVTKVTKLKYFSHGQADRRLASVTVRKVFTVTDWDAIVL